jgi:structural maintenance of chromosome 1
MRAIFDQDQMLEPETFLPLDYIQAKPLKERLRNITSVRGVKLLFDVLNFNPPDIKRAVLFVTNNSLVCETPEDAMKVAYEMEDGQRYSGNDFLFRFFNLSIPGQKGNCT